MRVMMTGGDPEPRSRAAYRGCLLGGAVGDALGAPVEFAKLAEIRRRFGPRGVTGLEEAFGRRGAITDDTQLTLFTAEGLIRWDNQGAGRAVPVREVVHRAYLRWLGTQGELVDVPGKPGWLVGLRGLHARRAPGVTCLSALRGGKAGVATASLNDSKGCGGVMRVAPVGLARFQDPFAVGCETAALTHGHPTGQLAAGAMAQLVAALVDGAGLHDAVEGVLARLAREPGHEETRRALQTAADLARGGRPSARTVRSLGEGWVAEEALAIGVYCALVATSFEEGVLLAVNHDGDSDSTGSIAGNLLGLSFGEEEIPDRLLRELELRDVVATVADDLWAHFGGAGRPPRRDSDRYPPG
jgi:ADP-ribosylglycohydrolase